MSKFIKLILCFFTAFVCEFALAGSENVVLDLKVPASQLIAVFTLNPKVKKFPPDEEYGMNYTKEVKLNSLSLDLHLGKSDYYIWRLAITGSGWAYRNANIFIGASVSELIKTFGQPVSKELEGDVINYIYRLYDFDSWSKISVRDGKIIAIFAAEDWS
jgi:hypothetical protein